MTIGRGSFLSELVERAGGRNLFADVTSSAGTVSIEAVASRDPDLILTTTAGPVGFAERPEWQTVRAVRERRFLPVSGSEFNRPSPRAPAAIRELARLLRERASMRKPADARGPLPPSGGRRPLPVGGPGRGHGPALAD